MEKGQLSERKLFAQGHITIRSQGQVMNSAFSGNKDILNS